MSISNSLLLKVTRSSYIDPRVLSSFEKDNQIQEMMKAVSHMEPDRHLKPEEVCVARLLNSLD